MRGRVVKVSLTWLMAYLCNIWSDLPADLCAKISVKRKSIQGRFYVRMEKYEADEVWSFIQKKENKQYIWLVQHRETRQIIAFEVGDRSRETLPFFKSLKNHILAIHFFICHYNLQCQKTIWKTDPIV